MVSSVRLCVCVTLLLATLFNTGTATSVGVNWGTLASHKLPPKIVVDMLVANNITKVKIFDTDSQILDSLRGTSIELMVAAPNELLEPLAVLPHAATEWLRENVTKYTHDVNIKYIAVGNEPFLHDYKGKYEKWTFTAFKNMVDAVNTAGLGDKIKVTVPLNADVLTTEGGWLPSSGIFREDVIEEITNISNLLAKNHAPFMINIYPFYSMKTDPNFPLEFVFSDDNGDKKPLVDGDIVYHNALDASHDSLLAALQKIGLPHLEVSIGEIGWPTDGYPAANVRNARRFVQSLVSHIGRGTPLRRKPMEVYLFGMFDEDLKNVDPGHFERHWGLFTYDGKVKYDVDLSGGNSSKLVEARGVEYLPQTWCIYNGESSVGSELEANVDYACSHSDCTPILQGGSCSAASDLFKASYAFNSYYQMYNQVRGSCYFDGYATVTDRRPPAPPSCQFKLQLDNVKLGNPPRGTITPLAGESHILSSGGSSVYGYVNLLVISTLLAFQLL